MNFVHGNISQPIMLLFRCEAQWARRRSLLCCATLDVRQQDAHNIEVQSCGIAYRMFGFRMMIHSVRESYQVQHFRYPSIGDIIEHREKIEPRMPHIKLAVDGIRSQLELVRRHRARSKYDYRPDDQQRRIAITRQHEAAYRAQCERLANLLDGTLEYSSLIELRSEHQGW